VWGKNNPRVRPVLATKLDQPHFLAMQLEYIERYHGPVSDRIYAAAGAPYYGPTDATKANPAATVDQIIGELDARCEYPRTDLAAFHTLAKTHGVKSIAYEGGVDLGQDETEIANKNASHYDPRMKSITERYLTSFFAGGGDEFVYYELAYKPNAHGHWGLSDSVLDLSQPKYQGAVQFAAAPAPAIVAGVPIGTIKFASYVFQSGYDNHLDPNGDVAYLNTPDRFHFLIRADADGLYPLSLTLATGNASVDVEVLADGAAVPHTVKGSGDWAKYADVPLGNVALRKGLNGIAFKTAGCNLRSFTVSPPVAPPPPPGPANTPRRAVRIVYDSGPDQIL
jgi:hypothetical protein